MHMEGAEFGLRVRGRKDAFLGKGVVAHPCNPSSWDSEHPEFQAILGSCLSWGKWALS